MANGMSAIREEKAKAVQEVKDLMDKATSVVFLGFKGMDVITVTDLRSKFRTAGVKYLVVKNTLIQQALKGSPLESDAQLEKVFAGETAVAFSFEDPSSAAKVVRDFRKLGDKQEKLQVKAAVLESTVMAGPQVEAQLASMPGKDELRAMLLATMQAPLQQFVMQINAPAQNLVYVLEARRKQLEEEQPAG